MSSPQQHRPFTLGVDFDNTCADYHGGLDAYMHAIGHPSAGRGLPPHYSYVESGYFADVEEYLAVHTAAMLDGMFANLALHPGARETMDSLVAQGITLVGITHRVFTGHDQVEMSTTHDWVRSTGLPLSGVVFTGAKHEVDVDLWIDDAPAMIDQLTTRGLPVIIYDRPHNAGIPGQRVTSWGPDLEATVLAARDRVEVAA